MIALVSFLKKFPEVVGVDLAYNLITEAGFEVIIEFMEEYETQLLKLNMMCNDIDGSGVERLAQLGSKLGLMSLRLNGNKFGAKGGQALALLLECNPQLMHLDVGDTDQTMSSLVYFTTVLRRDRGNNDHLRMLDLSRPLPSQCYQFDSGHFAEIVGQMLRYNGVLRELHLQKCSISDHDVEFLFLGPRDNNTLRLLDLSCNNVGCYGMKHIGDYLSTAPPLSGLMLGHNQVDNEALATLSYALPCSRIKLLDLSHNRFTDEGFLYLLSTIRKPIMLRCLYVWGNKITGESCLTIRRMLKSGVLVQDHLDIRPYIVDHVGCIALNNVDRYKHMYYCVNDFGFPPPRPLPGADRELVIDTQRMFDPIYERRTSTAHDARQKCTARSVYCSQRGFAPIQENVKNEFPVEYDGSDTSSFMFELCREN